MGKVNIARVMHRFGNRCIYCDIEVVLRAKGVPKRIWATVDHADPMCLAAGKPFNRKLACYPCNIAKGALNEEEFRRLRDNPKALAEAKRLRDAEVRDDPTRRGR